MALRCSICVHDKRDAIDQDIIAQRTLRDIAGHYDVSKSALDRHVDHIGQLMRAVGEQSTLDRRERLFGHLAQLQATTRHILETAMRTQNLETALRAVARLEKQLELEARLTGDLNEQGDANASQWREFRSIITSVLNKHPQAHEAVITALKEMEHA
jgi:heme oxygenase